METCSQYFLMETCSIAHMRAYNYITRLKDMVKAIIELDDEGRRNSIVTKPETEPLTEYGLLDLAKVMR